MNSFCNTVFVVVMQIKLVVVAYHLHKSWTNRYPHVNGKQPVFYRGGGGGGGEMEGGECVDT